MQVLAESQAVIGQEPVWAESQDIIFAESQTAAQATVESVFDTAVESQEVEVPQPLLPQETIAAPATAIIKRKNFFIFVCFVVLFRLQRYEKYITEQ